MKTIKGLPTKEYQIEWRKNNKEKVVEYHRKYIQSSKGKKKMKEYYHKNKEKIQAEQKKYQQQPEVKEKRKEYFQRPEVKERLRNYNRSRNIWIIGTRVFTGGYTKILKQQLPMLYDKALKKLLRDNRR